MMLGQRARCRITNFEGIITAIGEYAYNVRRLTLTPAQRKDGEMPDSYDIDETALEILDDGKVHVAPPHEFAPLKFGWHDEVIDPVTGFKGKVVSRVYHQTGCLYVTVQPPCDPKKPGEIPKSQAFAQERVELVRAAPAKNVPAEDKKVGGPPTRTVRCETE